MKLMQNIFFKVKIYLFLILTLGYCNIFFAATVHSLNEGIEAFNVGNFRLAQSIINEYINSEKAVAQQARIYAFAIQDNFVERPNDIIVDEIIRKSSECNFYKILEGRLHLAGMHRESKPKLGLKMIEELYEERYAAYTLGLFYEGKFGHVKSLHKADEWYKLLVAIGYQAAAIRLAEVQKLLARAEEVSPITRFRTVGENEWDSQDEWSSEDAESPEAYTIITKVKILEGPQKALAVKTDMRLEDEEHIPAAAVREVSAASGYVSELEELELLEVSFEDLQTIDLYKDAIALKILTTTTTKEKKQKALENLRDLGKLEILDLSTCRLEEVHLEVLSTLINLKNLSLCFNMSNGGTAYIAKLKNLVSLSIAGCHIEAEGLVPLTNLTELTELDLSHNNLGDLGAGHLSKLRKLKCLWLKNCSIKSTGAKALSSLLQLEVLDLDYNNIGDIGVRYLSQLINLTHLSLSKINISFESAEYLSRLINLTSLDVSYNNLGDIEIGSLSKLSALTNLNLHKNNITYIGVEYLSKLELLSDLDLRENSIGGPYLRFIPSRGARAISMLSSRLQKLYLFNNNLGPASQRLITEALPSTIINF